MSVSPLPGCEVLGRTALSLLFGVLGHCCWERKESEKDTSAASEAETWGTGLTLVTLVRGLYVLAHSSAPQRPWTLIFAATFRPKAELQALGTGELGGVDYWQNTGKPLYLSNVKSNWKCTQIIHMPVLPTKTITFLFMLLSISVIFILKWLYVLAQWPPLEFSSLLPLFLPKSGFTPAWDCMALHSPWGFVSHSVSSCLNGLQ